MVLVSTLFGGVIGFLACLVSLIFLDASFAQSLWVYVATGMTTALGLVTMAQLAHAAHRLDSFADPVAPHIDRI
jgi:spore maturation protein SpmA